jgi:hypothetical protein
MPHVGTASGNALLVWCLIAIAVCVCVVLNPVKFFRALAWGRPTAEGYREAMGAGFLQSRGRGHLHQGAHNPHRRSKRLELPNCQGFV